MSGLARSRRLLPALCALAGIALIAGCSSGAAHGHATATAASPPGSGQGTLHLVVPPGPVQNGNVDPRIDWATPFEKQTGCTVVLKNANSDAEAVHYLTAPGFSYDGVLASPEEAGQLIGARAVTPLNTRLIAGYQALSSRLRNAPGDASGGRAYGLPYVWDSYVAGFRPGAVKPPPRGWDALFSPATARRYAGKITLPDSPVTLALAALALKSARPSLGITDPFELTRTQFAAVVAAVDAVRGDVGTFWTQDSSVIGQLGDGQDVLGGVLRHQIDALAQAGLPADSVPSLADATPSVPVVGDVDSWLVSAKDANAGCMYRWLSWSASKTVQREVSAWTGEAPADPAACTGGAVGACRQFREADLAFARNIVFEHLPSASCGNGRTGCVPYAQWQTAWDRTAG